jgi:hypothetical protein
MVVLDIPVQYAERALPIDVTILTSAACKVTNALTFHSASAPGRTIEFVHEPMRHNLSGVSLLRNVIGMAGAIRAD